MLVFLGAAFVVVVDLVDCELLELLLLELLLLELLLGRQVFLATGGADEGAAEASSVPVGGGLAEEVDVDDSSSSVTAAAEAGTIGAAVGAGAGSGGGDGRNAMASPMMRAATAIPPPMNRPMRLRCCG